MCTMFVAYSVGVCMQIMITVGTQHLRVSQYVAAHGPLHGKQAEAWLLEQAVGVVNLMKENLNQICMAVSVRKCWSAEFSIPKGAQAL